MTPTIRARRVEDPSMATRVRHYDELSEDAKERLPAIVAGESGVVPDETAAGFRNGEVVKFTGYYRIEVLDDAVGVLADTSS